MEKSIRYDFKGTGLEKEELSWAKKRFTEYRGAFPHLNKLGSLQMLEDLVWRETIQERQKKQISFAGTGKVRDDGTKFPDYVAKPLQESFDNISAQINDLKKNLGMFEEQKTTDEFKKIQELEEKVAEYRRTHPLSFKVTSPYDGKIFYLKRRTEGYEPFISPFYADDKVLKNTPLYNLYKNGKITKQEMADVLGVSPDYVDWLIKKFYASDTTKSAAVITATTPEVPPATEEQKS